MISYTIYSNLIIEVMQYFIKIDALKGKACSIVLVSRVVIAAALGIVHRWKTVATWFCFIYILLHFDQIV